MNLVLQLSGENCPHLASMQKYMGTETTAAFFKQLKLQLSVQGSALRKYLMCKSGAHPPSHQEKGKHCS